MIQSSQKSTQNVCFFSKREDCLFHFESSSWAEKIIYSIKSCFVSLFEPLSKIALLFCRAEAQMARVTTAPKDGFRKRKLVVCLHGLNRRPTQFKEIIDKIKTSPEQDIYAPFIRKNGNSKLDKMVSPILDVVTQWAQSGGEKELVIAGISNGGRIARALEAKIAKLPAIKKLKVVSIVGAWNGSSLVNLVSKLHISWPFVHKNVLAEMPTNSASISRLKKEWSDSFQQSTIEREYTFIASPHDWHIPNFDSTLPKIPSKDGVIVRYALVLGTGHKKMEIRVSKEVAEIIGS